MPEVQSIGAADYAMPEAQQYVSEPIQDNIPAVYDPEVEEKRKAASSKLGLTLLGLAIAAGLGFIGGRSMGKGGKEVLREENEAMKEVCKDLNNEAKKYSENFFARHKNSQKFVKNVEEKTKPFVEDAEAAVEDVAKETEEAAKDAAKEA